MLILPSDRPLAGTEGPNFFVGDEGFALNRNVLGLVENPTRLLKKCAQLSLAQSTKVCEMCFWNF